MLGSLQNQVAIVTGGSRGIGRGIARVLAKAGANVLVAGLEENECREAAEELRSFGVEAEGIAGDVTKRDFCEKMVRLAVERWGRLDVLCANAGIFPQAKLEEMTEADFERVMNVNVKGTFLSVQAAIPVMKKQGYGRIVLTSSITGPITGYPGWAHYGAHGCDRTRPLRDHGERRAAGEHRDGGLGRSRRRVPRPNGALHSHEAPRHAGRHRDGRPFLCLEGSALHYRTKYRGGRRTNSPRVA